MIADRLRGASHEFHDYFERASIGSLWDTSELASASIVSGQLVTEGETYSWNTNTGAKYTGFLNLTGDFVIVVDFDYVARTSDLGRILLSIHDASDIRLALGGIHDAQAAQSPGFIASIDGGSSYSSGAGTRDASGNMIVKMIRTGDTLSIYEGTTLRVSDTMATDVRYVRLINERFKSYNGKTAKWNYIEMRW
jgi:hypothetical protein